MPSIVVTTEAVSAAAGKFRGASAELSGSKATAESAASSGADGAGIPLAAYAIEMAGTRWAFALSLFPEILCRDADNLDVAASSYQAADDSIP
jgi:hypothetical protein